MALKRKCDACRRAYIATRRDSKFCSPACRQRAARKGSKGKPVESSKVVELVVDPPVDQGDDAGDEPERRPTPVTDATLAELEAAGRVDTALGQVALAMARKIDYAGLTETGSSLAAAARGLRDFLADATKGSAAVDDEVERLRRRREERRRGA